MKPEDLNPENDPEVRITALLLGELTPEEETELRAVMAQNPELMRLHDRLKVVMGLVKDAVPTTEPLTQSLPEPMTLAEERRAELLAVFKGAAPKPKAKKIIKVSFWQRQKADLLKLAAMLVGLLAVTWMMVPKREEESEFFTMLGKQIKGVTPLPAAAPMAADPFYSMPAKSEAEVALVKSESPTAEKQVTTVVNVMMGTNATTFSSSLNDASTRTVAVPTESAGNSLGNVASTVKQLMTSSSTDAVQDNRTLNFGASFKPQAQSVGGATALVPLTASAPRVIALEDSVDRSYRARGSQIALPALAAAGGEQEVTRKTMADRSAGMTANFFSSMQNDGPIVSGNSLALNEGIADKPMGARGQSGSAGGGGVGSGVAVGQTHWGFGTQNGRRGGELANAPQRNQTGAWTVAPENDFVALPQGQVTQLGLADSRKLAEQNKPREMERLAKKEPAVAEGDMLFGGTFAPTPARGQIVGTGGTQPSVAAKEYAAMGRTERPAIEAYDVEAKPDSNRAIEAKMKSAAAPAMAGEQSKMLVDNDSFGLVPAEPAAPQPIAGPAPVATNFIVGEPQWNGVLQLPANNNGTAHADANGDRAKMATLGDAQQNVWFDSPAATPTPATLPQSKDLKLRLMSEQGVTLADSDGDGTKVMSQKQDGFNLDVVDLTVSQKLDNSGLEMGTNGGSLELSYAVTPPATPSYGPVDASAKGKKQDVSIMVQDAKLLMELRRTGEAEVKLKQALKEDPENKAAHYYKELAQEQKFGDASRKRDYEQRSKIVQAGGIQGRSEDLPVANPYARNDMAKIELPKAQELSVEELKEGVTVTRRLEVDKLEALGVGKGISVNNIHNYYKGLVDGMDVYKAEAKNDAKADAVTSAALAKALEALAVKPPEVQVQAKLAEMEQEKLAKLKNEAKQVAKDEPAPQRPPAAPAGIPQPEVSTAQNAFSTFSLNVSDVSFKLAAASLEKGLMPEPATVRTEEFINAFNYHDAEPTGNARVAFAWERARYPFAHDRDLVRFAVKTGAVGREPGKPLNIVLLLDNSGSMERADRVQIRRECLRVLGGQLQAQDTVSVVAFARTARLWVDGLAGNKAEELQERVGNLTPEGGTNLEEAMNLAYATAQKHFVPNGVNRVVLLTDGAANLGDVSPDSLKKKVVSYRQQGVALDCFGIGWEGYNDDLLEALSRNGDGRYGFVNSPEAATTEFASQLAGALQVAASDVKVQVEWNPKRVTVFRQLGYAKHQLKKEEFRDNKVDAAEIGAAEAGNALYTVQVNPAGEGPLGVVRVRYRVPNTNDYREHEWTLAYDGASKPMELSSAPLRLAATASAFSEWLVASPFAGEVTAEGLITQLSGVPEAYPADPRPKQLEWMIRQAKSLSGR